LNILSIALPERESEQIRQVLTNQNYAVSITSAFDISDITTIIRDSIKLDLIIIHYQTAALVLKDITEYMKAQKPHCKTLAFFEDFDENLISQALKKGADSFVVRSRIEKIVNLIDSFKKSFNPIQPSSKELILNAWMENSSDAIWAKDLHGRYILINSAGANFLKNSAENIIGKEDTELFPIETAAKIQKSDRQVLDSGQTQTVEDMLMTADGIKRTFQAVKSVFRDENGKAQGIIGTVRDISLRKQIEEALRQSEERFRVLVESIKDYAIFMVNPEGAVSSWNIGAERLIGYYPSDIIGLQFSKLFTEEDQYDGLPATHLGIALNRGRHETNRWFIRNNQDGFWANVVISPMYGDLNDLLGFSIIVKDLTEQKKAEDAIRFYTEKLEQSNKDLEEFAFIASHDLQAPLRKVRIFSEMLSAMTDDSGRDLAKRLEKSTSKMQALITDLLTLSRVNRKGKPLEVLHLNKIVSNVLDDLEVLINENDAAIAVGDLGQVRGDAGQFEQVFMNIISNSIKFRKKDEKPIIHIGTSITQDGMIKITVQDNGVGFDSRFSEKIFKPFERLHSESEYPGTGMGLAICKKIIERHLGTIAAVSEPGQGTRVEIFLKSVDIPVLNVPQSPNTAA
jgi:PAS domain S-box-containing protein